MPVRSMDATPERWKQIGEYVVSRREFFEMDQKQLVSTSGVSQSVVSKIENGRPDNNRVTVSVLRKLARALVMYPDALLEMTYVLDIGVVDARNVAWWTDVENAGGVEEFYDDLGSRDMDLGHRVARIELRLAAVEEALHLDAGAVVTPIRRAHLMPAFEAARGGTTEMQSDTVDKPPATRGFDPDQEES